MEKRQVVEKIAKKLGVRLKPPSLVLIYEEKVGVCTKSKLRIIPVKNFFGLAIKSITHNIQANYFHDIHGPILGQIEKMLRILQEHMKGLSLEEALTIVEKEYSTNPTEDLNKLSTKALKQKKDIMELTFLKNCIKSYDSDFIYDKRVNFDKFKKLPSDWDDTEDETDELPECEVSEK